MRPTPTPEPRIRLGISACLLGDEVRYDGGHKRDPFLTTVLGPHVEWVKVCPEVEVGMGTPREPIRLVDERGTIRLLTVKTGVDHTASMTAFSAKEGGGELRCRGPLWLRPEEGLTELRDDPRQGLRTGKEPGKRIGIGLFAHQALLARFPDLPVEEEGRPHRRKSTAAREFRRAGIRIPAASRSVRETLDRRRSRPFPYGA